MPNHRLQIFVVIRLARAWLLRIWIAAARSFLGAPRLRNIVRRLCSQIEQYSAVSIYLLLRSILRNRPSQKTTETYAIN